jgi:hypothetical protein
MADWFLHDSNVCHSFILPIFYVVLNPNLYYNGIITQMMKAARTSETLVNLYQTTWYYNPEDSHHHTCHHENLKSYIMSVVPFLLNTY